MNFCHIGGVVKMRNADVSNQEKAFTIYQENKGNIALKAIAKELGIKPNTITKWKKRYGWDSKIGKKRGAPLGNQNAKGHDGGKKTQCYNRVMDSKYIALLPESVGTMLKKIQEDDPCDRLWRAINIQEQRIIAILNYMNVDDDTKDELVTIKEGDTSTEYRHVFVYEKMAAQQDALGKAYKILMQLIKQYDNHVHTHWDELQEEQRTRAAYMKIRMDHKLKMDKERHELEIKKFEHKKHIDDLNNF